MCFNQDTCITGYSLSFSVLDECMSREESEEKKTKKKRRRRIKLIDEIKMTDCILMFMIYSRNDP
jgi:hypothetical protein